MSSPKQQGLLDALRAPANEVNGMVTGISPTQRLQIAMRTANEADPTKIPAPSDYPQTLPGVPNPYGRGLAAFEPNNIIFQAYGQAKGQADASKAAEDAAKTESINIPAAGGTLGPGDGMITKAVQAAMTLAQRAVPYVWGGTSANGVDCSGLLYYAFRSAGLPVKRWRAVDYAHLGAAVNSLADARPGDVIYYDNPGTDTDHVGLYLGNGLMVQAPQSGDHVRVTQVGRPTAIRRLFDDAAFSQIIQPDGSAMTGYNGMPYRPWYSAPISEVSNPGVIGSTLPPPNGTGYRVRAE